MKEKTNFLSVFVFFFFFISQWFTISLYPQRVLETLRYSSTKPRALAVYEGGNKFFVSGYDGYLYTYNGSTFARENKIDLGSAATTLAVHNASGKLYASVNNLQKVAVINAETGSFIKYLEGNFPNDPAIEVDEYHGKIYLMPSVLNNFGLWQVDTGTDAVTYIPGFDSGAFSAMALNPVTQELFLPWFYSNEMYVVNGSTLTTSVVSNLGAIGVGVNWKDNKVYTVYPMKSYDRDTGTITSISAGNDATEIFYNQGNNTMISTSEVNGFSTIIDCDTDEYYNLPYFSATIKIAPRHYTNHIYYVNQNTIGLYDPSTGILEILYMNEEASGGIQDIVINQDTGIIFAFTDNRLKEVTILQDTADLERPLVYMGNNGFPVSIYMLDSGSKEVVDNLDAPTFSFGHDAMAFKPGTGSLVVPAGQFGFDDDGIALYEGCSKNAKKLDFGAGASLGFMPAPLPDSDWVYLSDAESNKVVIADLSTESTVDEITVGSGPRGIVAAPDGSKVYVANYDDNSVSVINTSNNRVQSTILVGSGPYGVAIDPAGRKVYVANSRSGTVSIISTFNDSVIKSLTVGTTPHWCAVSFDGSRAYVSNNGSNSVSVINTSTLSVIKTVGVDAEPEGLAVLPDGSEVYVAAHEKVTIIDTSDYSTTSYTPPVDTDWYTVDIVSIAIPYPTYEGGDEEEEPWISLSRSSMTFAATTSGASTQSQDFLIENSGDGSLVWTAAGDQSWLSCSPGAGGGSGVVSVSVNPSGLSAGTYTGNISVSGNALNSPQTIAVILNVYNQGATIQPFGEFATPANNSTVFGSIPVTGWVLDDIGVASLKICRGNPGSLVYIGDAVFVEGARPDVEQAYPGYPMNYQAGWGYMLLTNFLPNGGNGTFKIHAIATDIEGHQITLGTKTIICDNANAVKPFGAIDTPTQGGMASGKNFINWGWVLTPQPNSIPTDGSTINVYVNGVNIGHPTYNIYRVDIANLFPGYANSDGAIGLFYLDTTAYENGVHTIQWTASDSGGNSDGIGSRYFTIQNTGSNSASIARSQAVYNSMNQVMKIPIDHSMSLKVKRGFTENVEPGIVHPGEKGISRIELKELERIEIQLSDEGSYIYGYIVAGNKLYPMPTGSTLKNGIFSWSPGSGFFGRYYLVFVIKDINGDIKRKDVLVEIGPKFNLEK
ncbi:MAG: beta-propeller fold lactonase family protein [Candidatus Aminicenantes bacterium]|nr:beta-propeller fold lactonase family protein [Candidatus Aminicenantes bacterium]NIN18158.1 beta-propeller fold lactonase family protein [Candidatus Aminicenantes bacterium]